MEAAVGGRSSWRKRIATWRGARLPQATVVLAPACASFDMFRDYAERGQVFKKEVLKLAEERSTDARAVNSRQSASGGMGAGCWERRLPRPVKLVSQPLD